MKIARCLFVEGENKGLPSSKKLYEYFIPNHIVISTVSTLDLPSDGTLRPAQPLHAVVLGGSGVYSVVRIDSVVDLPKDQTRATKALISLVDDREYIAGKERAMRAAEIVQELRRLDRQHKALERIRAIGAISPEAEKLVRELEGLGDQPMALLDRDED